MQLSNIKQFLDVYRKSLDTEDEKKETIQRIIKEEVGVEVDKKCLVVKNGVLHIKANTILNNEIFLHKKKIISALAKEKKLGVFDVS